MDAQVEGCNGRRPGARREVRNLGGAQFHKKRYPKLNGLPLSPEKRMAFFFDFLLDSLLVEGANGRTAKDALLHMGGHARKLRQISKRHS